MFAEDTVTCLKDICLRIYFFIPEANGSLWLLKITLFLFGWQRKGIRPDVDYVCLICTGRNINIIGTSNMTVSIY